MKKLIMMAVILFMSSAIIEASTITRNKKTNDKNKKELVVLNNRCDSLSYMGGMAVTSGLVEYITRGFHVDTMYMSDLIRGLNETITSTDSKKAKINAYVAGTQIAKMLLERIIPGVENDFKDTPDSINKDLLIKGFIASIEGDNRICNFETADAFFKEVRTADINAKEKKKYQKNIDEGTKFLAENAKKEGVKVTPSGLQYKVITEGKGNVPTKEDMVVVKYEGRLLNGEIFDSSYKRQPQTNKFHPTDVIKGWTEVLTMMPVGSKWEVYIPSELAYGTRNAGVIEPYSTLIFIIELVDIEK